MACRVRGLESGIRKPAAVKAARRAVAKGRRCGEEGVGEAWREEVDVGGRSVCRPERVVRRGWGGGGLEAVGGSGERVAGGGSQAARSMVGMSRLWR